MTTTAAKSESSFHWTTDHGIKIFGKDWHVENPKAVIVLAHGLGEHCLRYDDMARYFNDHKIAFLSQDFRGHGQSGGKRGHSEGFSDFLDEVGGLLKIAKERYPDVPKFLYGHSMGGNIVLNYVIKKHPNLAGLIVSAPSIQLPKPPSKLLIAFAKLMVRIFPGFSQNNGLDVNGISRIPEEVAKYKADPLVHDQITAITGLELLKANAFLNTYQGTFTIPTLMMHGDADYLTSPAGTRQFAERVKGPVDLKLWEGAYHEIHNEPERKAVYDYVLNWISERL